MHQTEVTVTAQVGRLQVSFARRMWLSAPAHLIGAVLVGFILLMVWAWIHDWKRPAYEIETEPAVAAALLHYRVSLDPTSARLSLRIEDKDLAAADGEPGALGLGRMASIRGILIDFENRLAAFDAWLRQSRADYLSLWTERDGFLELPLLQVDRQAAPDAVVRLPASAILQQDTMRPVAASLYAASLKGRAWIPAPRPVFIAPVAVAADRGDAARDRLDNLAGAAVAQATKDIDNKVGIGAWRDIAPLTPEQVAALKQLVLAPLRQVLTRLAVDSQRSYEELRSTAGYLSKMGGALGCAARIGEEETKCLDERLKAWIVSAELRDTGPLESFASAMDILRRGFEADLHRRLYTVTLSEAGFLWFFGAWRWWELVWWTVFGVMTMGIFQIANHAMFGKAIDGTSFDPRDALRVLARLFYAPVLTVVFFWLALATDLVDPSTVFATNSFGALAVAFLLGLAPNHLMRLMLRTLEVVVRGGDKDRTDQQKAPPTRRIEALPESTESVPTVSELKARLRSLVRAPLE